MKYAVALLNFFDNDNQVTIVYAENPIQALVEGARILMKNPDVDEWLDGLLKATPVCYCEKRIEEIQQEFFDTDMAISKPVPV